MLRAVTFGDLAAEVRSLMGLLRGVGIRTEATRLQRYVAFLEDLELAKAEGRLSERSKEIGVARVINAFMEASDLAYVHEAFGQELGEELTRRLRVVVRGPESYAAELSSASSNSARDAMAELLPAALLKLAGFDVHLDGESDVSFPYRGIQIFVEWKRPQTDGKVRAHIRKADRQLARRYERASGLLCRGLVGLNTTKLVNPRGGYLRVLDRVQLETSVRVLIDQFVGRHSRHWRGPPDRRSIGVLFLFRFIAWVENLDGKGPSIMPVGCFSLSERDNATPEERSLLRSIMQIASSGRLWRASLPPL